MILLDTHVLVWMIEGSEQLGFRARAIIEEVRETDDALVSPITAWETAMLVDKGRTVLSRPVAAWFEVVLATPGYRLAEMTTAIGADAGGLGGIHGDPADRLLIATARALGCSLLTADRAILAYAAAGHLQAIDAHR